jgi:hypothetical protein
MINDYYFDYWWFETDIIDKIRWRNIFIHTAWILFKGANGGELEIVEVEKRVCWCESSCLSNLNWKKNILLDIYPLDTKIRWWFMLDVKEVYSN